MAGHVCTDIYSRPPPNLGDSLGGRYPPHAWQPMSPKNAGPSSQVANTFGGHLSTRDGVGTLPSTAVSSAANCLVIDLC